MNCGGISIRQGGFVHSFPSIDSVFNRDPDDDYNTFLTGEWARPEFDYLKNNQWIFREKIHGTNIRIQWYREYSGYDRGNMMMGVKGRRDKSQVPVPISDSIWSKIGPSDFAEHFPDTEVCLYGEGYGPKVQKCGDLYSSEHGFVLFDVKIGKYWLQQEDVQDIASKLGIPCAPVIGRGTLAYGISYARRGFKSVFAEKEMMAEGLIMVPEQQLLDRQGNRVITKVKHIDFHPEKEIGEL